MKLMKYGPARNVASFQGKMFVEGAGRAHSARPMLRWRSFCNVVTATGMHCRLTACIFHLRVLAFQRVSVRRFCDILKFMRNPFLIFSASHNQYLDEFCEVLTIIRQVFFLFNRSRAFRRARARVSGSSGLQVWA